ncbi:MAG: MgtC/SapB family protein [Thermoanaerobacterales bacterium]|nr:MgtC/SapB family protein [Thermoanaerobacterales bacterium]
MMGGIIGLERESINRPAGFRTHILVCVGSTLTMLVSIYIFQQFKGMTGIDPGRIAAQVISGIGFLGAGTIIREGVTVKGLTTAASLWTVAAIGLAIGSGFYLAAILVTFLTIVTLISFSKIENYIVQRQYLERISLIIDDKPGQIGKIGSILGDMNVNIKNLKMMESSDDKLSIILLVRMPPYLKINDLISKLSQIRGIYDINEE